MIKVVCKDEKLASTIYSTLKPEEVLRMRSVDMSIDMLYDTVIVRIEAQDPTSMRIAVSSLLRFMKLATDVLESLQPRSTYSGDIKS